MSIPGNDSEGQGGHLQEQWPGQFEERRRMLLMERQIKVPAEGEESSEQGATADTTEGTSEHDGEVQSADTSAASGETETAGGQPLGEAGDSAEEPAQTGAAEGEETEDSEESEDTDGTSETQGNNRMFAPPAYEEDVVVEDGVQLAERVKEQPEGEDPDGKHDPEKEEGMTTSELPDLSIFADPSFQIATLGLDKKTHASEPVAPESADTDSATPDSAPVEPLTSESTPGKPAVSHSVPSAEEMRAGLESALRSMEDGETEESEEEESEEEEEKSKKKPQALPQAFFRAKPIDLARKFGIMTLGCVIYSLALAVVLDPNSLAPGGMTGIAMILSRLAGLPTGTWFLILNVPLFLLGLWKLGWKIMVPTLYCTGLISVLTDLFAKLPPITDNLVLATLYGAIGMGVGMGLVFRGGATTGGSDIPIRIIRRKKPYLKTGFILFLMDVTIIVCFTAVFGNLELALYALIVVFLNSFILDLVLYGRDGAMLLFIISDRSEELADLIMRECERGVTFLDGTGAYEKKKKKVIMCAADKRDVAHIEEFVKAVDPTAFIIQTKASQVYGEGYRDIFSEKI